MGSWWILLANKSNRHSINILINAQEEIESKFPEYLIDEDMDGLPTVIFSFLTVYLIESIICDENKVLNRFVSFVDGLAPSKDPTVIACLNEIFLGLYTSTKVDYKQLKAKLSIQASQDFQETIDLWRQGNLGHSPK